MTDFILGTPPFFNEGDHPISTKGPTLFQVVPNAFLRSGRLKTIPVWTATISNSVFTLTSWSSGMQSGPIDYFFTGPGKKKKKTR